LNDLLIKDFDIVYIISVQFWNIRLRIKISM